MRRVAAQARADWREKVVSQGLVYADSYWDETAYYEFAESEVLALEATVAELQAMCLEAAEFVVSQGRLGDYGITDKRVRALVEESWAASDRLISVYGRFDLRYDGSGPAKLLEYNADTPTSLVEAATAQWFWLEELHPGLDQWNSLHERLVQAWRDQKHLPRGEVVHFAYTQADTSGEDLLTTAYLMECATQAGLGTRLVALEDLGWDPAGRRFVDDIDRPIETIFKLYPWEWLVGDRFGEHVLALGDSPQWIEPAWKMLLSNKALLAILWELHPGHPNLLPAYLDGPRELATLGYVTKPLLGREGSGVTIVTPGFEVRLPQAEGAPVYGAEGVCYQAFHGLPDFAGNRPVLGAWVIDGEPAGLGIRETTGLITDQGARFLPHLIR